MQECNLHDGPRGSRRRALIEHELLYLSRYPSICLLWVFTGSLVLGMCSVVHPVLLSQATLLEHFESQAFAATESVLPIEILRSRDSEHVYMPLARLAENISPRNI